MIIKITCPCCNKTFEYDFNVFKNVSLKELKLEGLEFGLLEEGDEKDGKDNISR